MEDAWVFGAVDFMCLLLSLGEEEISFPPTYRYERGSRDTYAWHKQKPTGVSEKYRLGEPPSGFWKLAVGIKELGSCICCSSFCGFPEALEGAVGYFGNPRKRQVLGPGTEEE